MFKILWISIELSRSSSIKFVSLHGNDSIILDIASSSISKHAFLIPVINSNFCVFLSSPVETKLIPKHFLLSLNLNYMLVNLFIH